MSLPAFVPEMAPDVRDTISAELRAIEKAHRVRILFAVESGSRAWGFPSPDSDYDVRFVYVQEVDWYLSLKPSRDVIELPIRGLLDINGWDIRKALNLILKPNPVMLEWLSSPIRYIWNDALAADLIALAGRTAHGVACAHHYRSLGEAQWRHHVDGRAEINYKKYFYVLRPALALLWLGKHQDGPPPMNLQALAADLDLEPAVVADIARLLELKRAARETGTGPRLDPIDALIRRAFERAPAIVPETVARRDLRSQADALFRRIVKGEL